ncbi:NAD-dependent epimerase/dehydratase family protein [Paenibacillus macerans]|uniref:NAD-dependent epimerase/dehydratase family protein n=1 Tax=Paenibacillus macerans TaxID=44252 RepID=UPI002DBFB912|nr:NAD-dependent epimerase/dehydratase family protein [Paenibacillus macerans]MEC0329409.1 NAD-dependent epimerase/dehydratase family protein [Paenibacillus macerans]
MKDTIYLLTGAAGFLGNNISRKLVSQGKKVRTLVLNGDPAVKYVPGEADVVYGDLTDLNSLESFFTVPENHEVVVIHCASLVTTSPQPSQKVYDVNVTGTKNIVDMCVAKQVKKLVYVSSTGAILEVPHGQVIREPETFFPDQVVGYYAKTKAMATQYVLEAVRGKDLDASIIYPSGISGPNDSAFGPFTSFVIRYCLGQMPAGVEGFFNAVDVRDLADGVIACTEQGRKGEGYILSNEMVSMRRMFDLISEASGAKRVETILTPEQMQDMPPNSFTQSEGGANLEALKFEIYNLTRNNQFSSDKARQELDFRTRPFQETIADTVEWLRSEGKI